jgi:glutamate 5-kinase
VSDHGQWLASANRIVVKIGSNSVTGKNEGKIDQLVDALAAVMSRGAEVVLVSSGAIATGMPVFDFEEKPTDLDTFQALAAVGQFRLVTRYQKSLERHGIIAGQVLLKTGKSRQRQKGSGKTIPTACSANRQRK